MGLYYKASTRETNALLVLAYVDGIVIAASTVEEIRKVLDGLKKR